MPHLDGEFIQQEDLDLMDRAEEEIDEENRKGFDEIAKQLACDGQILERECLD